MSNRELVAWGQMEGERLVHQTMLSLLRVSPLTFLRIAQQQMLNSFKVSCKRRYVCL